MQLRFETHAESDNVQVAKSILDACKNRKIFAIFGDLGAGKTTLVKSICALLGVTDNVKSPTFSIVNEYSGANTKIFHFDFYRIKSLEEAYDLGYEEYFYTGAYCFIEWPEKIEGIVPPEAVKISIEVTGETSRLLIISFEEETE